MPNFKTNLRWGERFCYVNLAIGLVGIIVGVILFFVITQFQDFGQFYKDCERSFTLLIIIGVFFVILGLLGIYAQRLKSNSAMSIYNIGIILQMLFIVGSDDTDCTNEDLMIGLNTVYNTGKELLCSLKCFCNSNQSNFPTHVYQSFSVSKKRANKVNECKDYLNKIDIKLPLGYESSQLKNYVSLVKTSEEQFNCSGFYIKNSYYVFRDMNDGTPIAGEDCKQYQQQLST